MQSDNLIKATVGVAIGVLLLVTLALPILTSATETENTFSNEGMFYIDYNDEDTHTIEYEKLASGYNLTVDGENVILTTNVLGCTIVAGDDFILRAAPDSSTLQFKGANKYITGITEMTATVTATNFSATLTGLAAGQAEPAEQTLNINTTNIYSCTAEKTPLIMSNYNQAVYVNEDSEIFGFGQNLLGGSLVLIKLSGTTESIDVEVRSATTGAIDTDCVVSNIVIDTDEVNGYLDLYKLNKITFTVTNTNTSATGNYTFSAYIVPAEVTAEKAIHFDSSEIAILELVPLLLAVALVLGIIAYAVRARLS